ncbi:MAG: ATP-binding protein, partial [Desulfobacterales bacterium]
MDPSQLDQILANLCVNARDAITDVGKISVETQNTTLDGAYCVDHLGFVPGDFVMLTVSDDGCGMEIKKQERIFEPFFTTKKVGKGTGLGLATVYGIVKQNNGFINVYSEPGRGATFKIYLPKYDGVITDAIEEKTKPIPKGKGEWVLVVEDNDSVLKLADKMLNGLGYTVLTARTRG